MRLWRGGYSLLESMMVLLLVVILSSLMYITGMSVYRIFQATTVDKKLYHDEQDPKGVLKKHSDGIFYHRGYRE